MPRFLLVVLAFASICVAQAAPTKPGAPTNLNAATTGDEQPLMVADRAWNRTTAEKRLEGWMEYMADDIMLFSGKPVVGKAAVREIFVPAFADATFELKWEPHHAEMFPSGNMGYTSGRYEMHGKDPSGKAVVNHGSYLTVWRKQADGSWKVVADGGAPDRRP